MQNYCYYLLCVVVEQLLGSCKLGWGCVENRLGSCRILVRVVGEIGRFSGDGKGFSECGRSIRGRVVFFLCKSHAHILQQACNMYANTMQKYTIIARRVMQYLCKCYATVMQMLCTGCAKVMQQLWKS